MTQPFPYVAIAENTGDTITFADGTATPGDVTFNRRFWAPAISAQRAGTLGGRGSYQEVIEEIELNITASTVAGCYAILERINRILDTAERWAKAEYLGTATRLSVQMRYAPQGSVSSSTASYLRAVIIGRAPGGASRAPVALPPNFAETGMTRFALGVRLRLLRRGRWLLPPSSTWSSASTANGAIMTVSGITPHATMSPVYDLLLTGFTTVSNPTISAGILAVGCVTSDVIRFYTMSASTAAGYTTVADAANLPRQGTNVLRYTPTGTAAASSAWNGTSTPITTPVWTSPVAVVAVVRNNHASRVFQMRVELEKAAGTGQRVVTPYVAIEAGGNVPQIVRLGIVRSATLWDQIRVTCTVDSITGSPTLDIDAIYVVALHNETCRLIQHSEMAISGLAGATDLAVRVEQDNRLVPFMGAERLPGVVGATYYDAIDLEMIGDIYQACWISTRANFWRFTTTGGALVNLTANVRRSTAYLGPQ